MFNPTLQPNFDRHAHHYNTATPIQNETVKILANLIKTHAPKNATTWLDIGCGTGRLSQAVLKALDKSQDLNWYGLDNSPNMLTIFEQTLADFQAKNPYFFYQTLLATMQNMPLADNSINQAISSFALHWVGEGRVAEMVTELGRVVTPNGQIHVAIPVAGSLSQLHERCPTLPIYPFTKAENWLEHFDTLIQTQGGEWLYQEIQTFRHTYPNVRTLLKQLKQMGGTFSANNVSNISNISGVNSLRQYLADDSVIDLDYQVVLAGVQLKMRDKG